MYWIFFSFGAAILWGLSYSLSEQILKSVTPASLSFFTVVGTLFIYLAISLSQGALGKDWMILRQGGKEMWFLLGMVLCISTANLLMSYSVKAKSATLAAMVEICYPFFTALFAVLLFQQSKPNVGTTMGGMLIVAGLGCVYYFNKS